MAEKKISVNNILAAVPQASSAEVIEEIMNTDGIRIERIVSHGQSSPDCFWYNQDDNEWVILLKGKAALRFADRDGVINLQPGDYLFLPRNCRHRVEWTTPDEDTIWLAVHFPTNDKTP